MNPIQKIFQSIRSVGLRTALQTPLYTLQRNKLDRRYLPARRNQMPAPVHPGALASSNPFPGGADIGFMVGSLRMRFLAENFMFVGWNGADMQPSYAAVQAAWPVVPLEMPEAADSIRLSSPALEVRICPDGGLEVFSEMGLACSFDAPLFQDGGWVQRSPLNPGAGVYGLGERMAGLDLRPGTYHFWNCNAGGNYGPGADPLYINMPVYLCVGEDTSSLVFYDNPWNGTLTLDGDGAELSLQGGPLRFYVAVGTPDRLLELFTALTGRPPLPPRWALGYQQSRWGYHSEAEVRQVYAGFQQHNLPISALVLDIDHQQGYRTLTTDAARFPDLPGFARELAEQDVHLVAIIDPGVKVDRSFDIYRDGVAQDLFCKEPGGKILEGVVWPGRAAIPDFTDPRTRAWWGSLYNRPLEHGVSGIWHDMNEPTCFTSSGDMTLPLCTRHSLEGRGGDHREAHNVYGLLMNQAAFAGLHALRPESRPWILSRSGWVGMQRTAWTWTGDVESTWGALQGTIPQVLGLGLSGQPYSGVDIGGFSGHPSPELFVRWFQLGAFLPFFRTHCIHYLPRREPWVWGEEVLGMLRRLLELRYTLLPYWYTLAWVTSQSGVPLVRPLFWADPQNSALRKQESAFLLGNDLLVAPVVEEGARRRSLLLPPGAWYDWWSSALLEGSQEITLEAPLERIPLLARAGSILACTSRQTLELFAYCPTPGQPGFGMLYSDAGDGYGATRLDIFQLEPVDSGGWTLTWDVEGQFPFPYQAVDLHLVGFPPVRLVSEGQPIALQDSVARTGVFSKLMILPEENI